ncbi:ATP-binding protein [Candidatus Micrarchaeota archaeon]|nr:ATP-binding protein [Candidatus Micrarchaeota archaeon]
MASSQIELGTVISTFEDPSTGAFHFVVNSSRVRKGQFVQTRTDDGLLFGAVTDITRANRYFERAESVAEYSRSAPIAENFPTTDWEYTVACVKALGVFQNDFLLRSTFPAAPGEKVFSADEEQLRRFLGFVDDGLNLGKLQNHDVEVKVKMNNLLQKHLSVLGISGSGKSYFMSCLIEELLERKPEHGRIASVIVDIHGEYVGFASGQYGDRASVFQGKKIKIALHKLSPQTLAEFVPELSGSARRELEVILYDLKREMKDKQEPFDLPEVIQRVAESEIKENVKPILLTHLHQLKALNLFGKADNPSLKQLALPGRLCVLDLSDLDNPKRKQLIVAYFARRLFKARKKGKIPPFVLLVEEAHNFAPERLSKFEALSKPVINLIAREGRKFGASLCLISQRPKYLSTTALSQCNSNIIFRITNPYDVKHIAESCESIDQNMANAISTLRVGEAIILGEAVSYPIFVKIRSRRSRNASKSETLESLAKKFEQVEEQKKQDVEAFL